MREIFHCLNVVSIASAGVIAGSSFSPGARRQGEREPGSAVPPQSASQEASSAIVDSHGLDRRYSGVAYRSLEARIAAGAPSAERICIVSDWRLDGVSVQKHLVQIEWNDCQRTAQHRRHLDG